MHWPQLSTAHWFHNEFPGRRAIPMGGRRVYGVRRNYWGRWTAAPSQALAVEAAEVLRATRNLKRLRDAYAGGYLYA